MSSILEVRAQITFQLSRLTEKNAHHEFEHMCRDLARARICSNILPATGPVSAGGDQGRDFETFITHLRESTIANSTFVGLASDVPICFACSLNKDYNQKVKDDVKTIVDGGFPGEEVHFFSSHPIDVSDRHKLEKWAKQKYKITLQVHDSESIAELLSDREIFWIAQEYLNLSSEIYPRDPEEDDWYKASLDEWKNKTEILFRYAEFTEVKLAVRHATFASECKQDLPFWLSILEKFRDSDAPESIKRRATYELVVLSLRGLGHLKERNDDIQKYLSGIDSHKEISDLEDAVNLIGYCSTAIRNGVSDFPADEMQKHAVQISTILSEELQNAPGPNTECSLLMAMGFAKVTCSADEDISKRIDDAMETWLELAEKIQSAPLFSLGRFAKYINQLIDIIGEHPKYRELTRKLDTLVADRFGRFEAAKKSSERAIAFQEKEMLLRAIDELHHAKHNWFSDEHLRFTVLTMLLISDLYLRLKLTVAAKYYALAASYIAIRSSDPDVKQMTASALATAAECEYYQGAWSNYLELTFLAVKAFHQLGKGVEGEWTGRMPYFLCVTLSITERFDIPKFEVITKQIQESGIEIDEWIKDVIGDVRTEFGKLSESEIWQKMQEDLADRPFNDLENPRKLTWKALGITWIALFDNAYETTAVAEQFIATLQVWLADIAEIDLCLMSTEITMEISVADVDMPEIEPESSNESRRWTITLPQKGKMDPKEPDNVLSGVAAVTMMILEENSLLPVDEFRALIEERIKEGLSIKCFSGRPYEEVFADCYHKETFEKLRNEEQGAFLPSKEFEHKEHVDLAWIDDLGPGYSKEEAVAAMKRRYDEVHRLFPFTIEAAKADPGFQEIVKKLRDEGWLDGCILNAIAGVVLNYKIHQAQASGVTDLKELEEVAKSVKNTPESSIDDVIPISALTEEELRRNLRMSMMSTLDGWGLQLRQGTPNLSAIEHFLRHRYRHFDDDAEHEDPFV